MIKKGDKFRCINDFVMAYTGEVAYRSGMVYESEWDGCITDAQGRKDHLMTYDSEYFVKLDGSQPKTEIESVYDALKDLAMYKNEKYGNSALEPINVLSKSDSLTGLMVRADDKIARIKNSKELRKNDVVDLIGYLVLICVTNEWNNFDEFKD